jgi:hypothetical protein
MPTIRNKTPRALNLRIGRPIAASATLEVTPEEAEVLDGHPLLEITLDPAPSTASNSASSSTAADTSSPATGAAAASTDTADTSMASPKTTKTTSKAGQAAATPEEDSK